jgi:uncharacterized protein (DUF58 family)
VTRPTRRGAALLAIAVVTFVAALVLGTWELYLMALSFGAMIVVAWIIVAAGSLGLTVEREVTPSEPVAGDPLEFAFTVRAGWRVRGLHIVAEGATGGATGLPDGVVLDDGTLRAPGRVTAGPRPARRGVHSLPAYTAVVEDPLGLVQARRACGEPLRLTIAPRLEELDSCPLCSDAGVVRGGRPKPRLSHDAWELRGIRPHVPGEPLNRVDWKSTAKTGALMLRETEAGADEDAALLLDGRPTPQAGAQGEDQPDAAFETAVEVAGSMAAFLLESGHRASLFLSDGGWRELRLAPDTAGRRRLLSALAEVQPKRPSGAGSSLPSGLGDHDRRRPLVLVTSQVDDDLVHGLAKLRRDATSVSVVHVLPDDGERSADAGEVLGGTEATALQDAGVRYVALRAGAAVRGALLAGAGPSLVATRRRRFADRTAGSRHAEAR